MKKSILFGALAMFAIGALSIQDVNAQNAEVKSKKTETTVVKPEKQPVATTVAQEPVKQKKDDCCADKKACADKKKGDCCAEKKVVTSEKQVKADCKKECKHGDKKCDATKPALKKTEKTENKETATHK